MNTLSELGEKKMDFFKDVVSQWGIVSLEMIAAKWDVKKETVSYAAMALRKKGIPLPRLSPLGWFSEARVAELKRLFEER